MAQLLNLGAALGASKTGLAIGYILQNMDGTTQQAFTTTNVVETSKPGTYVVTVPVSVADAGARIGWGIGGVYDWGLIDAVPSVNLVAGAITAAVIATNAIDADAIAADAVTELQSGLATAAALTTVAGYIDTEVASILAAVDTEVAAIKAKTDNLPAAPASTTNITAGTITTVTNLTNAPTAGDLTAVMKASVTTAATAATPTAAAVTGNVGGNVVGSVGSVVGAVGSVTGNVGGNVTGSVGSVVAGVGLADGAITAAKIATDAITAAKLAADVTTEIQAGLATAAALATLAGYVDTEVAAILAAVDTEVAAILVKVNALPTDPADASDIAAAVAAIQADTDNIQTRLPAALVSGRMDSSVGAMAANTLTASALATDAVTEIQSGLATTANVTAAQAAIIADTGATETAILTEIDTLVTGADFGTTSGIILAAIADVPTAAELDAQLVGTHGAGSWLTATGFATPANVTAAQSAIIADTGATETTIINAIAGLNDLSSGDIATALTVYDTATGADVTAAQNAMIAALDALGPADITIVSAIKGNTVGVYRRDTWRFAMTLPIDLSIYEAVGFVIKTEAGTPDADALAYVRSDVGLVKPTGAPTTGSLIVAGSSFSVLVDITQTDVAPGNYTWWLKVFDTTPATDEGFTRASGRFVVEEYGLAAIV